MILRFLPLLLMGSILHKGLDKLTPLLDVANVTATQVEVSSIVKVIELDSLEGGLPDASPEAFAAYLRKSLSRKASSQRDLSQDAWGTPYRLKTGAQGFLVVSAGPDQMFGTKDDIRGGTLKN